MGYFSESKGTIIYEPKNKKNLKVKDLYKRGRMDELLEKINLLDNEDLKEMLKIRANQFAEFNFTQIANYYAYQATAEEQDVIESLALVIMDYDQLIEHGFADIIEEFR